jgi:hypothetical protein
MNELAFISLIEGKSFQLALNGPYRPIQWNALPTGFPSWIPGFLIEIHECAD